MPDAGPIFAALALHILSGLIAVIAGALPATARKQPGRHPRAERVYVWGTRRNLRYRACEIIEVQPGHMQAARRRCQSTPEGCARRWMP